MRTPQSSQQTPRDFGDFSSEYGGRLMTVKLFDGTLVAGKIVEVRKFFIKMQTSSGTIYINKAYIVAIY
ncbi:MAG: hypothetical protein QW836_10265 [Ignisphaera sp.]